MAGNNTVGEVFGKQEEIRSYKEDNAWVLPTTMIGLELELEGVKQHFKFSGAQYWDIKEDGSLRDINEEDMSTELVFSIPLCGYDLTKALSILKHTLDKQKEKPVVSPRCSTHVHMDVRELNFNKLLNLLIIYTIMERPLYHYCGSDRENNNFCLPFYKAEHRVFDSLSETDILGNKDGLINISVSDRRYSGLNLCALRRFGSLEFRQLPGTLDIDKISQWINIIMCIKKAALHYAKELQTLPKSFSEEGIEKKVKEIFDDYYQYIKYPELEYDVLQGIRQAQDIIYSGKMHTAGERLTTELKNNTPIYYNKIVEKFKLKTTKVQKPKEAVTKKEREMFEFIVDVDPIPPQPHLLNAGIALAVQAEPQWEDTGHTVTDEIHVGDVWVVRDDLVTNIQHFEDYVILETTNVITFVITTYRVALFGGAVFRRIV